MRRILFITATRIGDAVLYSGVLDHLIEQYPDGQITLACGPLAAPLFRGVSEIERIIVMAKQKGGGHWFDLWRQTMDHHWDLIVDLRGSIVSWFLRSSQTHVHRRKPGHAHRHRVIEASHVLGLDAPRAPRLWLDEASITIAKHHLPDGNPILALSPSAAARFKEWPAERFSELANRLVCKGAPLEGARVALFGGPGDEARGRRVAEQITETCVIDLTGQLGILETGACLAQAQLFIGNDSGLMHMSAAAGVATLGLFGPTDEAVYGPWGKNGRSVRAGDCADESDRARLRHSQDSLMGGLELETVYQASREFIEDTKG